MNPARMLAAFAALALLSMNVAAQQKVPLMANGTPVAPIGLSGQPLAAGPFLYRTAEQQDVKVTVVARDLEYPYSMAFLPSGELLVTERPGRLRIIRNGVLDPKPISGAPAARYAGVSGSLGAVHGYMSVVVHPRFAQNRLIYFTYNKPIDAQRANVVIARARLENGTLVDMREFLAGEGLRGAVCLAMTPDGMLWIASGGDVAAQDPKVLAGKVLRLRDDGSVPQDNPFVGKEGHRPEIYSMGHRAALGLTVHRLPMLAPVNVFHEHGRWMGTFYSPANSLVVRAGDERLAFVPTFDPVDFPEHYWERNLRYEHQWRDFFKARGYDPILVDATRLGRANGLFRCLTAIDPE